MPNNKPTWHRVNTAGCRPFKITVGTSSGYNPSSDDNPGLIAERTVTAVEQWQADRANSGLVYLTGVVSSGTVVYAWVPKEGTAQTRHELVVQYTGILSPAHDGTLTNAQAQEALDDLARTLGNIYDQTRVYSEFGAQAWVLEQAGRTTPRSSSPRMK